MDRCGNCGLVYAADPPSSAEIREIYTRDYFAHAWEDGPGKSFRAMKVRTARAYLALVERHLPARPSPRRLLDIGCAQGHLLEVARERGFEAHGVEISDVAIGARQKGFTVYDRSLTQLGLASTSYDVITLIDVLEHLTGLQALARELYRILRPGGLVLLVTPDVTSRSARILRGFWPHYKREHLAYFSPRSLSAWLRGGGLTVLSVGPAPKYVTFTYVARHFARYTPGPVARTMSFLDRLLLPTLSAMPVRVRTGILALGQRDAESRLTPL